jgi:hypothetical protein
MEFLIERIGHKINCFMTQFLPKSSLSTEIKTQKKEFNQAIKRTHISRIKKIY